MNTETKIIAGTDFGEDLYYGVHKGLRLGNARLLIALGQLDPADDAAVAATLERLDDMIGLGLGHLTHENAQIHSAIEARLPGASEHAGDDHAGHERSFAELRALAADVAAAKTDRAAKLRRLYQRFAVFLADDLLHMHEEETELMPLMQANFGNDELVAIRERIVAAIAPEKMVRYMRIMLAAASRPERIDMLTGMHAGMPQDAFGPFMTAVTGTEWRYGDWDALEAALR